MTSRVAVVTGAGRGIGRAVALSLAGAGWSVVVNDLGAGPQGNGADDGPAETVAKEIRDAGGQALASTADISNWDASREMIRSAVDEFGQLDGVVNCAGILRDGIFHKMPESDWDSVLKVHLKGSFSVSRAAAEVFREQSFGAFVHMTSTAGLIGNLAQANYSAAKLGIVGLSRSIALDMARYNVRSNTIAPFAWSRLIGTLPDETPAEKARLARMKAMKPEQVAPLVNYLLGEEAENISGQIFVVRGNEIMLMSQPRPLKTMTRTDGWSAETLASHFGPAIATSLVPLETSPQIFSYDPA
ncbi:MULTISPECIES: SDR family NAD(P)-dependent oxidoreductase [Rhodococcus]|uniref:SDR family NAD(P)-dependent oxidoreductase n=1 Tax=Rhodococcus TaxID=1827 RepID=UPI000AAC765B|nr:MULTISPECIES: SDR family NAD(P)-dependent oxidoreductase [Rhodococcus]QQZ14633.1 SDR family oxidoreductase [Rhodococcus sp. 21391]